MKGYADIGSVTKQTKAAPNSPDNHADFIENTWRTQLPNWNW